MNRGAILWAAAAAILLAVTAPALAQHEQHRSGRQRHQQAEGVGLETRDLGPGQLLLRLGPMDLPARTDHHAAAQPPDVFWEVPFDGWLTAYHPALVDAEGNAVPGRLLHHTGFWHTARPDFLCPNKPEHIFGAGGELNDWPAVPGFGYRVRAGERIRIDTMVHNPTDTDYRGVWLEVRVEYQRAGSGPALRSYYPAWFDVQGCRNSGYDLKPGSNVTSAEIEVRYDGLLLGVGGHLHDYGLRLEMVHLTRNEPVASLVSQLDPQGRIESMPSTTFLERGGYRLATGDRLRVTAFYDNRSGRRLPDGAMGIVVGYFVPEDDQLFAQLQWTPRSRRPR